MSKLNGFVFLYFLSVIIASTVLTSLASYCEVRNKELGFTYNLTQLSPSEEDVIIEHDSNKSIRMQLCSSLKKKCNGQDGYAICLIENNTEKGIGKLSPKVDVRPGGILFNFTGDNCLPGINYTVKIIIHCDYDAKNNSHPELFPYAEKECNIHIDWRTAFACTPSTQTNCTVVKDGYHFDLSPLTRSSENYVIFMGNKTKSKIALNVCQSIIRQSDALCPIRSGVCLNDIKSNRSSSLGDVYDPPSFVNGKLQIVYQNGSICRPNILAQHIQTTITFICDYKATKTIPEYVRGEEDCNYQLTWNTTAACSIESLRNYSAKTAGKCFVTNPVTNFTYNLQSLMNRDFTVTSNISGTKYKFRLCGALENTCGIESGICNTKHNKSLGRANSNLIWQQGGPYLNYTNGDSCENEMRHYTVIGFFCGPEGSPDVPMLMEEYPCQTVIHWNTNLVCEKRIKCATNNDDEINLTPLIQSAKNYVVKVNGTEFHINICRPLVPTPGLTCAHGSAACKVTVNSENEYVNEISLGFPDKSPILNKDIKTVLRYTGGSECPENSAKLISSNFTFICDNNNQGFPVYKHYIDCTYVFEWNTSIACGAVTGIGSWTPPCIIKDSFLSNEYDLSLLHKTQKIHYVKNKQGKEYGINICGGEKYCNRSAVCLGNNGYGSLGSVIFDYSRGDVKLKYTNGSKCHNNSYTSEVRFICNKSVSIGTPKLLLESQCSAEFEWHTEIICAKHANSQAASLENPSSSFRILKEVSPSHAGTVAGVVLTVIAVLAALIYFRKPEKRAYFRSWIDSLSFRRNSGRVQYCRVDTSEEARLLLDVSDPTQCQTDSDDDLLHA